MKKEIENKPIDSNDGNTILGAVDVAFKIPHISNFKAHKHYSKLAIEYWTRQKNNEQYYWETERYDSTFIEKNIEFFTTIVCICDKNLKSSK